MSPHGLLVHRERKDDEGANNLVTIKVLKVKFSNLGINDASCQFGWNVNNGRYDKVVGGDTVWDNSNWLSKDNKYSVNQLALKNLDNLSDVF